MQIRNAIPKTQGMLGRWIEFQLKKRLDTTPVVTLLGPRQTGKTTLAKEIGSKIEAL
ncbi:ATP-binding protein [bacterium]|nr:ATP-binding protein [bacterium]